MDTVGPHALNCSVSNDKSVADAPVERIKASYADEIAAGRRWIAGFEALHGRRPRVLHVGNIANNAFLNAKCLRRIGIDAEVLCNDYTHIMAMPEWEEVDLRHSYGDDLAPIFAVEDLASYERPTWFHAGPIAACHQAICDIVKGSVSAESLDPETESRFNIDESLICGNKVDGVRSASRRERYPLIYALLCALGVRSLVRSYYTAKRVVLGKWALHRPASPGSQAAPSAAEIGEALPPEIVGYLEDFAETFPDRPDQLKPTDVIPFLGVIKQFREIFDKYDIVQLYSTGPLYGWLAGNKPYVGFEHGTLRDFTQGDDPLKRLTSIGYRKADHVFITNGDCLEYALRIGVTQFSPAIHPIDVEQHRRRIPDAARLKVEHEADILLLCPLRHDWRVKGTDIHLHALPIIRERVPGLRVKLVLTRWGRDVDASERLLEVLGCADDIVWVAPLCRIALIRYMQAADVVLDQIALPHFGGTAPQSLAAGTPVISSYDPESTAWIVDEPAPIIPAFTPKEVAESVIMALDPAWRRDFAQRAEAWVNTYHHSDRSVAEHLRVYRKILEHGNVR